MTVQVGHLITNFYLLKNSGKIQSSIHLNMENKVEIVLGDVVSNIIFSI